MLLSPSESKILRRNFLKLAKSLNNKYFKSLLFGLAIFGLGPIAEAQLYNGQNLQQVSVEEVLANVRPGTVLLLGEVHDSPEHHANQQELLKKLLTDSIPFNLAMEFFEYPDQLKIDQYLNAEVTEESFLKSIGWGQISFDFYREQVWSSLVNGGWTYGINIPRSITRKVSKSGLSSLDPDDLKLMPPNFELGQSSYFERFADTMKGHVSDENIEKYFAAQSIWDDCMAWKIQELKTSHFDQSMVVLVGDFHLAFMDGLPFRLKARGANDVIVISQITDPDELKIDSKYGVRADYIWLSPGQKNLK